MLGRYVPQFRRACTCWRTIAFELTTLQRRHLPRFRSPNAHLTPTALVVVVVVVEDLAAAVAAVAWLALTRRSMPAIRPLVWTSSAV